MKPIIGILGVPFHDNEDDKVVALFSDYINVVFKKDCIPFMINPVANIDYFGTKVSEIAPLTDKEKEIYDQMVDMCDGIIMPGGYRMYEFDTYIIKRAIEKDIPVLGICMGMQLLANIDNNGYSLEENNTEINHKQPNVKYAHKVNILENTKLSNIITEKEISVNSKHRYHVSKVNNFIISAYSEDGLIEAIELPEKRFVLGVQWHPEKLFEFDNSSNEIFNAFVDEVKVYKKSR